MERTRNEALAEWMAEHQMTEGELADAVNGELGALTGRDGLVSDRTVRRWLSGETRWPQTRQCKVLEQLAAALPRPSGSSRAGAGAGARRRRRWSPCSAASS
ncbi:hypothetical protein ACFQ2B_40575 [Streptomyces stramineus]